MPEAPNTRSRPRAGKPAASPEPVDAPAAEPAAAIAHEHVAERAFHKYLARGGDHGRDADDWIEAERELAAERDASGGRRAAKRRRPA